MNRPIAVAPDTRPAMHEALSQAVKSAGGRLVEPSEAEGLIWADPAKPDLFPSVVDGADRLVWIQLPYAGIEPFAPYLDDRWIWTCGKGVYAPAVAESVMAMILALVKNLPAYTQAETWLPPPPAGRYLSGSRITILGGGGIAESLLALLEPFSCSTVVVRRHSLPVAGADQTTTLDHLPDLLPQTDLLILALALTSETQGLVDAEVLGLLPSHALLINVARGGHVVTEDLVEALAAGTISGAALDVTDPEPLPDGHPLWVEPRCLITPHVANTPEMGLELLTPFVKENVRCFLEGRPLRALVDLSLGY